VQTTMDVAILVPGRPAPGALSLPGGAPATGEWDVSWSVARLVDDHPEWLLLSSPDASAAEAAAQGGGAPRPGAPTWRPGADRVVVLDVDGTAPANRRLSELPSVPARHGEIARWLGIARAATPGARPIALLQTTDEARLRRWRDALERRGGTAGAIQDVGAPTLTAVAQVLAVQAAGAARALTLATRYRPVLLFDRGESPATDTPYDIDSLLRAGRVTLCHDDRTDGSRCDAKPITRSADLINGPTHLKIAPATSRTPPVTSAIYVHPTTIADGRRSLLYLDYWWYLDGNPAREGHGASCGLGLAIPGKTCFDHPADWEGMTVVVDVTAAQPVPVAIQYAEHKNVVRYDYAALRKAWDGWIGTKPRWMSDQLHDGLAQISDVSDRPLAFVAQGTHASYATACNSKDGCRQVVAKVREHRHNGGTQWFENDTADCVPDRCVQLIPTRRSGREPALWNSFKGLWGDRTCILAGAYCTFELSPGSPASQPRYRNPAHVDAWVDAGVVHRCGKGRPSCPAVPAAPRAAAVSGP